MREWANPGTPSLETLWRRWQSTIALALGAALLFAALYAAIVVDVSKNARARPVTPITRANALSQPPAGAARPSSAPLEPSPR